MSREQYETLLQFIFKYGPPARILSLDNPIRQMVIEHRCPLISQGVVTNIEGKNYVILAEAFGGLYIECEPELPA